MNPKWIVQTVFAIGGLLSNGFEQRQLFNQTDQQIA